MALLAMLFALVFVTELISWIGQSVLLEFFYSLYLRIFYSSAIARQKQLKSEILLNKKELLQTSAQDQFAKWAKMRRSVDKGLADLEKLNGELATTRTSFSLKFNSALWVMTTGLQFFIGWWFRKAAVFYLPPGWFGPLTWWLALPLAPAGSVSCGVWQIACRRVIKVGERVVREVMSPSASSSSNSGELLHCLVSRREALPCRRPRPRAGPSVSCACAHAPPSEAAPEAEAALASPSGQRSGRSLGSRGSHTGRGRAGALSDGTGGLERRLISNCLACFGAVFGLGGPASRAADLGFRGPGSASEQERKATSGAEAAQDAGKKRG